DILVSTFYILLFDRVSTEIYTLSLHDALPISYLTGISMGGYGAWHLAEKYSSRFAAMIVICGGIHPPAATLKAHPDLAKWYPARSEEHTSELQSPYDLVCRLLLEKKKRSLTIAACAHSTYIASRRIAALQPASHQSLRPSVAAIDQLVRAHVASPSSARPLMPSSA